LAQFGPWHFLSVGADLGGAARDTVAVASGDDDKMGAETGGGGTATGKVVDKMGAETRGGGAARSVADFSVGRVGEVTGDEKRTGVPARLA
jgi:hypothetical protein